MPLRREFNTKLFSFLIKNLRRAELCVCANPPRHETVSSRRRVELEHLKKQKRIPSCYQAVVLRVKSKKTTRPHVMSTGMVG